MKRIVALLCSMVIVQSSYGATEPDHYIPETITMHNSSARHIVMDDFVIEPGESQSMHTNDAGTVAVRTEDDEYVITYPRHTHYGPTIDLDRNVYLDFQTIQYLAGDLKKLYPEGLHEISVLNDTLYKIASVVVLNNVRSASRVIHPNTTNSEVVKQEDGTQSKGATKAQLIITFMHELVAKKCVINFTRALQALDLVDTADWRSVTLCANTLKAFANGFKVKKQ